MVSVSVHERCPELERIGQARGPIVGALRDSFDFSMGLGLRDG